MAKGSSGSSDGGGRRGGQVTATMSMGQAKALRNAGTSKPNLDATPKMKKKKTK